MDNIHKDSPAKMQDGRFLTDFRSPSTREEYSKKINNIVNSDDYRLFLQHNGEQIMDAVWEHALKLNTNRTNTCIHKSPTRSTSQMNHNEMALYNTVRSGSQQNDLSTCEIMNHYRLTDTKETKY